MDGIVDISEQAIQEQVRPNTPETSKNEVDKYIHTLGHYKDLDLPPVQSEIQKKDGEKEITVYGTTHTRTKNEQLALMENEVKQNPSDVYLVEVEPSKLQEIINNPNGDDVLQKFGESAYIAWIAHKQGKEVRSWDIPFIKQLEAGFQKHNVDAVIGSVIGQGLIHIIDSPGDRSENLINAIKLGLGEDVLKLLEERLGNPLDDAEIRRIINKYSLYDLDSMTKEDASDFFRPEKDGEVNKANATCVESRDENAIREIYRAKNEPGKNKLTVVTGADHTKLWIKSLELMYPENTTQ